MSYRQVLVTGLLLLLFAVAGTAMVAFTYQHTHGRIVDNERAALLHNLHLLVPPARYDNNLFKDTIEVRDPRMLGTDDPVTVYRARKDGKPVAAVLTPVAPDGYGGAIRLLVGIDYDGTIAGVRVLSEHETPGLGDKIEADRSDWIFGFAGKSIGNPPLDKWKVKKDGGAFDQFTGATITPRAVVKAIRKSLIYFSRHREALFAKAGSAGGEKGAGDTGHDNGPAAAKAGKR
ncbi:MAG TPA: electron transport complex subunit RsxG [Gammaproteobacteria bacterium]|nr:electron transport complex subunit RsxG [Gammaproteobacteria bacterium]